MLRGPWLPVLLALLLGPSAAVRAEDEDPVGAALRGLSGEKALALSKQVGAEAARARKKGIALGGLLQPWVAARMSTAGLQRAVPDGSHLVSFTASGARGHNVLGVIPGRDPKVAEEVILLGARAAPEADHASGASVLLHLAAVLTANGLEPRRTLVFCTFAEAQDFAGAAALAAALPFPGRTVAMFALDRVAGGEGTRLEGVGAYPTMKERFDALLPAALRSHVEYGLRARPDGDHWPFHERGIPAFRIASRSGPSKDDPVNEAERAAQLEATTRLVGTLAVGLAKHPEPLTDPLGTASYLIREGPRFALDQLMAQKDGSLKLARHRGHAGAVQTGLSALAVTVSEDLDPAESWKVLEGFEAQKGAVRYRLVRRVADIDRAHAEGSIAMIPRLCCARAAHADPTCLPAFAKLGYRWIAPWATGTRRRQETHVVEPIAAAAEPLKVILDACSLPVAQHAALRKALGKRPAVWLPDRHVEPSADLGPMTLPFVRFRRSATWQRASEMFPGLAPAIFYAPRGERLAQAIATWGATQPAGWDAPGSPQRQAIRAALGGRLVTWLGRAER